MTTLIERAKRVRRATARALTAAAERVDSTNKPTPPESPGVYFPGDW